jgi:PAS domain S-box-containing protein
MEIQSQMEELKAVKMEQDQGIATSPPSTLRTVFILAAIGIGLVGLWLAGRVSYLLFHSLVELFVILVAWGIFIIAWNSRRFITHSFFLFLGVAFLAVGALELLHILAYKGMGVFPGATADLPTQLWIAARSLEAVSLLVAPFYLTRRVRAMSLLSAYSLATVLLGALIFSGYFPTCFVEGPGLTTFKTLSEYLVCVLLAGAIFFVYQRRQHLDQKVMRLVIAALGVNILSELSFTLYVDVYGLFNMVGHYLKIISWALLYKAIIETGLQQPYRTLFRELAQSEGMYRKLFEAMTEGFAIHEIICDDQGRPCDYRFLQVNPAFERLTGLKAADIIGRTLYEVLPQSEGLWVERYGSVALTGQPAHFEQWSEALGRHYEISAFQTRKGCFGVLFVDVTERKQTEEKTRELLTAVQLERDRLSALVNSITDEVWFADTQKQFTLANPSALEEFGIGTSLGAIDVEKFAANQEVYRPDGSPRPIEEAPPLRALQGEVLRNQEEIVRSPLRGELRFRQVSSSPVRDTRGHIIGSVSVARDITELKRMEEELRKSRDELEVRVRERTAELAQSNEELTLEISERLKVEQTLQESKKQLRILASQLLTAQEIERKRIALEVHDVLGSSLSAIKFKAEEALGRLSQDGTLDIGISRPLKTLIPLIKDTIEEARRIQADLRPPLLDDLGLVATFSWFCRRFKTIYPGVEVEQEVTIREEEIPDHLKITLFRITQEAMNNIVKHAKADSVYLGMQKVDGLIELCIKDNGEGFDPESLSSRDISKKGLGLSSMKERIEFSGGIFSLNSIKGKGTVIRAVWPI